MSLASPMQDMGSMPHAVHEELWKCIDARLQRGDTLVKPLDFQKALEADYMGLTGEYVSKSVKRRLAHSMVTFNRENPDRYVALGVRNSARRAFQASCIRLGWDQVRISTSGLMAIVRLKSFDRIRELLREAGVKSISIDPEDCIQHAIRVVSGQQEPIVRHDVSESIVKTEPKLSVFLSAKADSAGVPEGEEVEGTEGDKLTNEERRQGASIGRVETRVAGAMQRVLRKLMPSPDGSGQHLLAQRHPETGELEPALYRGVQRTISRGIDGVWREV